jgi:hypothetical protein
VNRPEEQLQRTVVEYLQLKFPRGRSRVLWFATTPQRGTRTRAEMGVLKAMGQLAGVADLLLIWGEMYTTEIGFIELKSPAGRQSPSQKDFGLAAENLGARYTVCRSLDQVVSLIEEWEVG